MDGVNEPDENVRISNLSDPDAENKPLDESRKTSQTQGRKRRFTHHKDNQILPIDPPNICWFNLLSIFLLLQVDNFIHADMHPRKILVRNKSSRKRIFKLKPNLIFLDVGIIAELSYSDTIKLLEFFKAFS
ncbi:hypothetical protein Hanom_Chr05g00395551 [Helianthus anomalus]